MSIYCLCGSTRFITRFQSTNQLLTEYGHIVLSVGCDTKSSLEQFALRTEQEKKELKAKLDVTHYKKIEMSNIVLFLNVYGYLGESSLRELEYAQWKGKEVQFIFFKKEDKIQDIKHGARHSYDGYEPWIDGDGMKPL